MTRVHLAHRAQVPGAPATLDTAALAVVRGMVEETLAGVGWDTGRVRSASILIKPNLVRPRVRELPAMCTDPRVILTLVEVLRDLGASRVSVGENPGYRLAARIAFADGSLADEIRRRGAEVLYLDEDEPILREPEGAVFLREVLLPRALEEHDLFLNLPKLKTHMHALVSLGVKNLHGLVFDEQRMIFHRGDVDRKVVDILAAAPPDLTLIDGIWAMEGQAPFHGDSIRDMNVLVAGADTVATDAAACRLMGIHPEEVSMLRLARADGLGSWDDLELTGSDPASATRPFRRPILCSTGAFPKVHVLEGGACRGCLSALRHSLDKLAFRGELEDLPECTVYLGRPPANMTAVESWKGDLWLFGDCARVLAYYDPERRTAARHVAGCPPHVLDLHRRLTGGEPV